MFTSIIKEASYSKLEESETMQGLSFSMRPIVGHEVYRKPEETYQDIANITSSLIAIENFVKKMVQPTPLDLLRANILSYGNLPDYEHSGVNKPTKDALQLATQLLNHLPSGMPIPHSMISEEGGIGLYWDSPKAFADLEIEENGQFSIFTKIKESPPREDFFDGLSISPTLQSSLKEKLKILLRA